MRSATSGEARAFRITRHALGAPAPADRVVDAVHSIAGVHAQPASSEKRALGVRVHGLAREALAERHTTAKKTRMPRGRLHLVAAADPALFNAILRGEIEP